MKTNKIKMISLQLQLWKLLFDLVQGRFSTFHYLYFLLSSLEPLDISFIMFCNIYDVHICGSKVFEFFDLCNIIYINDLMP